MDERYRRLERDARQGDRAAAASLLGLRMRQGLMTMDQVELLAYAFYEPAWDVMEWRLLEKTEESARFKRGALGGYSSYVVATELYPWSAGLVRWGRETALRAAIAAALHRFQSWRQEAEEAIKGGYFRNKKVFTQRLESIPEAPGVNLEQRALDSVRQAIKSACWVALMPNSSARRTAANACASRVRIFWVEIHNRPYTVRPHFAIDLARLASNFEINQAWLRTGFANCSTGDPDEVRQAARDALVSWLVFDEDPVREVLKEELEEARKVLDQKPELQGGCGD